MMQNPKSKLSIIVFSKDRPLQLQAYLASIQYFSKSQDLSITVLYKPTPQISYEGLLKDFPDVLWVEESSFYQDLLKAVSSPSEYILFGCDDVIFKDFFDIPTALSVLQTQPELLGFSLRLGKNIKPIPSDIKNHISHLEWNWFETKAPHWNYPWELDCTIYRKDDVIDILSQLDVSRIKNPNFLESDVATNPGRFIKKHKIASFKNGKAIVLTVNRVQDDFGNEFDTTLQTDVNTLYQMYLDGSRIAFKRISKKPNHNIHVGVEYSKLTGKKKFYNTAVIETKIFCSKVISNLKRLLK